MPAVVVDISDKAAKDPQVQKQLLFSPGFIFVQFLCEVSFCSGRRWSRFFSRPRWNLRTWMHGSRNTDLSLANASFSWGLIFHITSLPFPKFNFSHVIQSNNQEWVGEVLQFWPANILGRCKSGPPIKPNWYQIYLFVSSGVGGGCSTTLTHQHSWVEQMQLRKPSTTLVLEPLALTGKWLSATFIYVQQKYQFQFHLGSLLRV